MACPLGQGERRAPMVSRSRGRRARAVPVRGSGWRLAHAGGWPSVRPGSAPSGCLNYFPLVPPNALAHCLLPGASIACWVMPAAGGRREHRDSDAPHRLPLRQPGGARGAPPDASPPFRPGFAVIDARLYVSPNARLARRHDALGNIIDTASFEGRWRELLVVSRFTARHTPRGVAEIKAAARMFRGTPLLPEEAGQIMLASQRSCADPSGAVAAWAGHAAGDVPGRRPF